MTEELEITLHDQITLKKKEAQHCIWNYILNSKPTFAFFRKKKNQKPTYIKNLVCIFLPCHLPTEGREYQNLLFSPTDWDGLTSETGNHNISQTSINIRNFPSSTGALFSQLARSGLCVVMKPRAMHGRHWHVKRRTNNHQETWLAALRPICPVLFIEKKWWIQFRGRDQWRWPLAGGGICSGFHLHRRACMWFSSI